MADEKTVEVELLAGSMRDVDGVKRHRGDAIRLPADSIAKLKERGVVGDKGAVEKQEEADDDRAEREAHEQRILTGLEQVEGRRRPGRPRKTEAE